MPETAGGRRAGQSELRLPRRTGKSQSADRSHNSAHGREVPARSAEKRADPVVYLAGGPGDIAPLEVNGLIAADFIGDRDILVKADNTNLNSTGGISRGVKTGCPGGGPGSPGRIGCPYKIARQQRGHDAESSCQTSIPPRDTLAIRGGLRAVYFLN